MMKTIPLIAMWAALPLMAQEQPAAEQPAPACACAQQSAADTEPDCPQAAMAACFGFQKGFHMGFEAGFAKALHVMRNADCRKPCCQGDKPGKMHRQGPRPEPAPAQNPATPPAPAEPPAAPAR